MSARLHACLTDDPLSLSAAYTFVADPSAGAVVTFAGTVRDHSEGRAVAGLTYEAFAERAQTQLKALAGEVALKWPDVRALWLEHRTGALAIGEVAVLVAVSARRRADAFDAARYTIDTLKSTVAIWKKEHWADSTAHWPGLD